MDQILLLCTYRNTMGMPHQEISFDYIRLRHKSSVRLLLTTDASILTVSVTSLIRTLYFSPSQIPNNSEWCVGNNECKKQPNLTGHWKISSAFQDTAVQISNISVHNGYAWHVYSFKFLNQKTVLHVKGLQMLCNVQVISSLHAGNTYSYILEKDTILIIHRQFLRLY
jgi:hypothetical protein